MEARLELRQAFRQRQVWRRPGASVDCQLPHQGSCVEARAPESVAQGSQLLQGCAPYQRRKPRAIGNATHGDVAWSVEKTVAKVCTQLGKADPAPPRPRFKAIAEPPAERSSTPPEGGEQMLCRHVSASHNAIDMHRFLRVSLVNASRWQRCFACRSGSLAGAFPLPRGNNNSCMYYVIHVMLIVKHPAIVTLRFHQ